MLKFRVSGSQAATIRPGAISVVATAHAKSGAEDRLKTAALALVAPSRAEVGNISYHLHQEIDDPATFVFFEVWENAEVFNLHKQSPHLRDFLAASRDLLDGELKVTLLDEISEPEGPKQFKKARASEPKTREFKLYHEAKADSRKKELMDAASAALARVAATHPDAATEGLRPDDLYETVLLGEGLRGNWETIFGGEDAGRHLFGLVAYNRFCTSDSSWLATPSQTPGLGKRGWTYLAESAAPDVSRGLEAVPAARDYTPQIGDCVWWPFGRAFGRVYKGPDQEGRYMIVLNSHLGAEPETGCVRRGEVSPAPGRCSETLPDNLPQECED